MSKKKVIAVFDIGKTNKKVLLFDEWLKMIHQEEHRFDTTTDEDGFECDDIDSIEKWILATLQLYAKSTEFDLVAVNFSTYGASLAFLDNKGRRLAPIYNYLKEVPETIQNTLFDTYGGVEEFCRKTASPALSLLLNSGIQILWLKKNKPEIFKKVAHIVHFPQYLSNRITHCIISDATSLGCHTFLWDFDNNCYHQWLEDEGIRLPDPMPNNYTLDGEINTKSIQVGIGIHDSSSSLAPYIMGSKEKFLLVSTGTWSINMNPFNTTPLTHQQLQRDCLSFLSIRKVPVKSSRLFMGHIHDVNMKRLTAFFEVADDSYKQVKTNESLMQKYLRDANTDKVFFAGGIPANYIDETIDLKRFADFDEAYHRFMFDLTRLNSDSINLISNAHDGVKDIYISGGFARNEIFVRLLASFYPEKRVYTSQIDNASALGAALVIYDAFGKTNTPSIDLGLKKWVAF